MYKLCTCSSSHVTPCVRDERQTRHICTVLQPKRHGRAVVTARRSERRPPPPASSCLAFFSNRCSIYTFIYDRMPSRFFCACVTPARAGQRYCYSNGGKQEGYTARGGSERSQPSVRDTGCRGCGSHVVRVVEGASLRSLVPLRAGGR